MSGTARLLVMSHTFVIPVNRRIFEYVRQDTGWEVTLLLPTEWDGDYGLTGSPDSPADFAGRLLRMPVLMRGSIPLHVYRSPLVPVLRKLAPDVIYAHNEPYSMSTSQLFAANSLSVKAIAGVYASQNIDKRYPLPIRLMRRRVLRQARFACTISQDVLNLIGTHGYRGPAAVTPPGVDEALFHQASAREELRAAMQIGAGEVAIAYVGRLVEEKGLATLLRALSSIRAQPWRLVVAGNGPFEGEFDRLAAELEIGDRITRLGYIAHAELPGKMGAFDVLVLPSETRARWKEQFGRVLVEALVAGVPVVGSSSGAIPEVIGETGGGLVFPEADAAALAAALGRMVNEPLLREQLAATGGRRARDLYSQKTIAGRIAGVMEAALRAGRTAAADAVRPGVH